MIFKMMTFFMHCFTADDVHFKIKEEKMNLLVMIVNGILQHVICILQPNEQR